MSLWQRPNGPASIAANSAGQSALNVQASLAAIAPASIVLTAATEAVVTHPQNPLVAFTLPLSPNQGLEQVSFDVVISGFITTTSTSNVTIKCYSGTSLTVGSDTLLASSGALAQNTASAPYELHLHLVYDSVSGKMGGWFEGVLNNLLIARTIISNVITGIKDSNNPVANFLVSATSSGALVPTPTTVMIKNFTAG